MGLNDSYSQARSQILMRSPIPTVNQAYALIVSDGGQKFVVATSGILGSNPTSQMENYEVAMYSKVEGNQNQNQRFRRNYNLYCEFCKMKGHSKENCYKIVGYPADLKNKRRGNAGTNAIYNVNLMPENNHSTTQDHQQLHVFNYGQNTNVQDYVKTRGSSQSSNVNIENTSLENYALTKTQYEQILQMLNKTSVPNSTLVANVAVTETSNPKKVLLPNGDITPVTHTGSSSILENNTITTELFTGKVKRIGKEHGVLYLLYTSTAERNRMAVLTTKGNDTIEADKSDVILWHGRCGHVSTQTLRKLLLIDIDTIRIE
ncbi:uncharacterized protein [Nicotiana tomentosiformis]|uniref:uncharacterized protein n=1 Tax=Nicotiana tomentosiformis TaxID=4098 RepID=UPI00388C445D